MINTENAYQLLAEFEAEFKSGYELAVSFDFLRGNKEPDSVSAKADLSFRTEGEVIGLLDGLVDSHDCEQLVVKFIEVSVFPKARKDLARMGVSSNDPQKLTRSSALLAQKVLNATPKGEMYLKALIGGMVNEGKQDI